MFDGSLLKLFQNVYPNHIWLPWKFSEQIVPRGYWNNHQNQCFYLDWLGSILGFQQMDDWYKITTKHLQDNGGYQILNIYGNSPSKLLQHVYPEYDWSLWKFDTVPKGYWQSTSNIENFINRLATQLDIQQMDDWYQITTKIL